ncbi:MAG: proline dehydrogenase family protein [Bacteroidales bacterium]|nr:proline dehydrogenase family protein [Bacteroidales bacterium]MBS3773596.1 proline dehydrogenase family protein [Bacteroidales bacterium]
MIDFENTKIAFQNKTNIDLKRARFLFNTLARPYIVKTGKLFTHFALKTSLPIKWIVKPTVYKQFCGGETIEECKPVVESMAKYNVKSILDYSVEGKEDPEDIKAALEETLRAIENAGKNENIPFAVFKPTAFARSAVLEKASSNQKLTDKEQTEVNDFRNRIDTLCGTAYQYGLPILIDAEEVCYQYIIDEVAREMMRKYNREKAIVFNTLQMYRWDRLDFLTKEFEVAQKENFKYGAKFVRGAYMEKERKWAQQYGYLSPIHPDKASTDRDYNDALKFSVENIEKIAIFNGTHNESSSLYLVELMDKHQIPRDDERIYFSQLFGMSDHISYNLANAGYNVAKYLPYGPVKNVMPYLIRRAEENTSARGQTNRELELIKKELKRRKTK